MKFCSKTHSFCALPWLQYVTCLLRRCQSVRAKPRKKIKLPESVRKRTPVAMKVVPVNPSTRRAIQRAAGQLDSFVESKLIDEGQSPNSIASDEVFFAGFIWTLQVAFQR